MKQFGYISGVFIILLCSSYGINKKYSPCAQIGCFSNCKNTISFDDSLSMNEIIPDHMLSGKSTFGTQCQRCHTTSVSHAKDAHGWEAVISRMSGNAGLDSLQQQELTAYVLWELARTDTSVIIITVGANQQW